MRSSVLSVPYTFSKPTAYPKDDTAIQVTEKKDNKTANVCDFCESPMFSTHSKMVCVCRKCIENYNNTCHKNKLAKYNYPASNLRRDSF